MEFEGRTIPDDDDKLTELIRQEAHRVVVWEERDDRPPSPIDWVSALLREHPELVPRVELAYGRMLAGADPIEVREILEQAERHPGNMVALLDQAVAQHSDALRAQRDTTNDQRSLLGAVVEKLSSLARTTKVSPEAARTLAAIDSPADGWPTSFRMALVADFDGQRGHLVSNLQRLAGQPDLLMGFVRGLLNAEASLVERSLDEVGRAPLELREQVGAAIQQFLEEVESSRRLLLDPKTLAKYPPEVRRRLEAERPDPWPGYASRLGLPHAGK